MAYKALYRTYRPMKFEEVAGQEHIVKTLKNALATGKIAHAYLFAGPRGTGKTTMAKLLAKALNCDEGIGCECQVCKNCKAIMEGNHPDVIEIDAASNNGVDEVRDLIDKVKYGTILGRYKVYIIDEVHMMTQGAFNALLKTLEEPPAHVIFILATTEPHKIIPTILSRCQRYDFSKLSGNEIAYRLHEVLEKEGVSYEDEAVDLIISLADGGMRDALSILDQVLAYSGNNLKVQDVLDIFALESTEEKLSLINSIVTGDLKDVLNRLKTYIDRGSDIKRLTNDLLVMLKDVLIYNATRSDEYFETLNVQQVKSLSSKIKVNQNMQMIDILMDATKDYKNVTSINPIFEMSLLKMITMFSEIKQEVEQSTIVEEEFVEERKPVIKEQPKVVEPVKEVKLAQPSLFDEYDLTKKDIKLSDEVILLRGLNTNEENQFIINDDKMINIMVLAKKSIKNELLKNWTSIKMLSAHPKLAKCANLLVDAHPLVAANKILILECALTNITEKVNTIENQTDLQNVIENVFGTRMFVYAVSRVDSIRLQQKYMNLLQLSKLPKATDIVLEFEGE